MSADTPESIPTSSDRHSKRPTKRRALTPVSQQAATVESLFLRPDQEIRIPVSGSQVVAQRAVPEIVTNVQGSSAGAGSGEFHVYKASRRREYERLRLMDEEVQKEKMASEFEKEKREKEERDAERTRRNREKREKKKKARSGQKAKGGEAGAGAKIQPRIRVDGVEEEDEARDGGDANRDTKPISAAPVGDGPGLLIRDDDD